MALTVRQSAQFRRDVKRLQRQNQELSKLEAVVETLIAEETLEDRYKDHTLIGNWKGYRECHIQPDWLLIYRIAEGELQLVRTGSHSALFG
jgi:mRNA interferase YafQ